MKAAEFASIQGGLFLNNVEVLFFGGPFWIRPGKVRHPVFQMHPGSPLAGMKAVVFSAVVPPPPRP